MPNFDLTQLNSLITTNGDNPISTNNSDMPIVNNMNKQINWQLLAGFLDQEIFQFILANKDNEVITQFGIDLASKLATNFGLSKEQWSILFIYVRHYSLVPCFFSYYGFGLLQQHRSNKLNTHYNLPTAPQSWGFFYY